MIYRFPEGYDDLRSSLADLDADDGMVTSRNSAPQGPGHVELGYTRATPSTGGPLARAQQELIRDLDSFASS